MKKNKNQSNHLADSLCTVKEVNMVAPYKLCFLGYRQLTSIAQRVIPELPFDDCDIQIVDCLPDTLPDIVDTMSTKGFEVFIAGGANAAVFSRHSQAHLQEISVRVVDYLIALKKAQALGGRIAIAYHRMSRRLDEALLTELSGVPVEFLRYDDSSELYDLIRDSDYDVIIGASQACSYAIDHGKKSVLVYEGEDTVRRSIYKARNLAIELRKEQKYRTINNALVRNLPAGIVITDEEGRITTINQLAREYLNVPVNFASRRLLSDIVANLSPDILLKKGLHNSDSFRIINGVRFRCQQNRLVSNGQDMGVLTVLRVDNTRRAEKALPGSTMGAAKWKELVAVSEPMKQAVSLGKKYAMSDLPLALIGDVSAHQQIFSECIHTGGNRVQGPLITVNLPQISAQDAGRHLLGSSDVYAPHTGLLEMANHGTLVLKNVQDACPAVQDILLDALTHNRIIPVGGYQPIEINIRFISIFDKLVQEGQIREDLMRCLCTLHIDLPQLGERKEDLPILFQNELSKYYDGGLRIAKYQKACDVLKLYSWPGNMSELQAAAGRFALLLNEGAKITPSTVQNMLVQAIGEEALYQELVARHPCLNEKKSAFADLNPALEDVKHFLGWSNAVIAQKLGVSRSTLWRALNEKTSL